MTLRVSNTTTRLIVTLLLLTAGGSSARAETVRNIFFAEAPARLVRIYGAPVYQRIPQTALERIVNTNALIVRDAASVHYLKALDGWMESYGLMGDWSVSGVSPFGEKKKIERAMVASTADRLEGGSLDHDAPSVFIATQPAALIVTDGAPVWKPVPGTSLQYLGNTRAKVFREPTDEELYVRVGGDWYRAWTTDGPWQIIAMNQLPADIAKQIAR